MLEVILPDVAENNKMRDYIIAFMLTHASFSCSRKHKSPFSLRIVVSVCRVDLPLPGWLWAGVQRAYLSLNVLGWGTVGLPLPEWFWAGVQRTYLSLNGCGLGYIGRPLGEVLREHPEGLAEGAAGVFPQGLRLDALVAVLAGTLDQLQDIWMN